MKAILHASLFEDSAISELDIGTLIQACDRNDHHVVLTKPSYKRNDLNHPINRWLGGQSPKLQNEIPDVLERGMKRNASASSQVLSIQVRVLSASLWDKLILCLEDAIRLFQEPLGLLLENEINDLAFLRCLSPSVHRRTLEKALEKNWVCVRHGGGLPSMKTHLEELLTSPAGGMSIRHLRTWVLCDRDTHEQDRAKPSDASNQLVELCKNATPSIPCQQLHRRSIENYLPVRALDAWTWRKGDPSASKLIRAFKDAIERDKRIHWYISMKKGLLKDVSKPRERRTRFENGEKLRHDELDPVFHGLTGDEMQLLAKGFGEDVASVYSQPNMLAEDDFQKEYDCGPKGQPTRSALLQTLLDRI